MLDAYNQIEKFQGVLQLDGKELGTCWCEFHHNPLAPNAMRAELTDPPTRDFSDKKDGELTFVTRGGNTWYVLKLEGHGQGWGNSFSMRSEHRVLEFREETWFQEEYTGPIEIDVAFAFPPTSVSVDTELISHHAFGLIRGDFDRKSGKVELRRNPMHLPSAVGDLTIAEELRFHRTDGFGSLSHVVTSQSYVGIGPIQLDSEQLDERMGTIRETMGYLFECVSVIERDRINWHTERFTVRAVDGDPIGSVSIRQWVPPPRGENAKDRYSYLQEQEASRNTLRKLFTAYELANTDVKNVVKKMIDAMKIAYTMPIFEAEFIHWHSCLDFFKKIYSVERIKPFSRALVVMFDEAHIAIDDLLPADQLHEIRTATSGIPKLAFTDLRDSYIHEGFDVFNDRFAIGFNMLLTMRSLVERLLLHQMGVPYVETSLGQFDSSLYPPV